MGQEGAAEENNESSSTQSNLRSKAKGKGKGVPKHAPARIKRGGRAGGRTRRGASSSEEEEESEDSDFENRNPVRKSTGRRQVEPESPRTPATRSAKKPTSVSKVINDSDTSGKSLNIVFP